MSAPATTTNARTKPVALLPEKMLLDVNEAAAVLGVCERTVRTMREAGELPYVEFGRRIMYPSDGLRRWIHERTRGGTV